MDAAALQCGEKLYRMILSSVLFIVSKKRWVEYGFSMRWNWQMHFYSLKTVQSRTEVPFLGNFRAALFGGMIPL